MTGGALTQAKGERRRKLLADRVGRRSAATPYARRGSPGRRDGGSGRACPPLLPTPERRGAR